MSFAHISNFFFFSNALVSFNKKNKISPSEHFPCTKQTIQTDTDVLRNALKLFKQDKDLKQIIKWQYERK